MHKKAQFWIGISNREESMARLLSRADFNEGSVLHAHRAAFAALMAVLANNGWSSSVRRCKGLCIALGRRGLTLDENVHHAAKTLDAHLSRLDAEAEARAPADACSRAVAARCLTCVKRVRHFVSTVLTES